MLLVFFGLLKIEKEKKKGRTFFLLGCLTILRILLLRILRYKEESKLCSSSLKEICLLVDFNCEKWVYLHLGDKILNG